MIRCSLTVHLLSWQFWMIGMTPSKSSSWSSRPSNDIMFFANRGITSRLQPHIHEIRCLYPNSSIEVSNILSLINHHCVFRFWANRVGTIKRMNMELQTFKWSKDGSK